jgi:hypothetical protein
MLRQEVDAEIRTEAIANVREQDVQEVEKTLRALARGPQGPMSSLDAVVGARLLSAIER